MSLVRFNTPLAIPPIFGSLGIEIGGNGTVVALSSTSLTIDAATEKVSMGGHLLWEDGGTHTIGSSSSIKFRTGTVTFATSGSTIRLGIQDFAGDGSGNVAQLPDGTFDVYRDIVVGDGLMDSSSDNIEVTAALTTGSKSVAHGQEIAVVWDFTTRNGSDSVNLQAIAAGRSFRPGAMLYTGSAWSTSGGFSPLVQIVADDGVRGVFAGGTYFVSQAQHDYQLSSNPDEYGLLFTAPFTGKIIGFMAVCAANSAVAELVATLFADPFGTPTSLGSKTFPGESFNGSATERCMTFCFDSPIYVVKGQQYALGLRSTGTANISLVYIGYTAADDKKPVGLTGYSKCSREGGIGAFTETNTHVPGIALLFESIAVAQGGVNFHLGMN